MAHFPALDSSEATLEPALPTGEAKTSAVRAMFDTIAQRYELLNGLLTFGLDRWWRLACVDSLGLGSGALVLDLACGTGNVSRILKRRFMGALGVDLSKGMLERARLADPSTPVLEADGSRLPLREGSVDGLVSAFALRNFTDLQAIFHEAARVLRPGGRVAFLDVAQPANPLLGWAHSIWFNRAVPLIGGLLSDRSAYSYLPRSVEYLPTGSEIVMLMESTGFEHVSHRLLTGGITQLLCATRT